jgi:chromosome segregation ATPase
MTREEIETEPWFGGQKERVLALLADRDDWKRRAEAAEDQRNRILEDRNGLAEKLSAARDEVQELRVAVLEATEQRNDLRAEAERLTATVAKVRAWAYAGQPGDLAVLHEILATKGTP